MDNYNGICKEGRREGMRAEARKEGGKAGRKAGEQGKRGWKPVILYLFAPGSNSTALCCSVQTYPFSKPLI